MNKDDDKNCLFNINEFFADVFLSEEDIFKNIQKGIKESIYDISKLEKQKLSVLPPAVSKIFDLHKMAKFSEAKLKHIYLDKSFLNPLQLNASLKKLLQNEDCLIVLLITGLKYSIRPEAKIFTKQDKEEYFYWTNYIIDSCQNLRPDKLRLMIIDSY